MNVVNCTVFVVIWSHSTYWGCNGTREDVKRWSKSIFINDIWDLDIRIYHRFRDLGWFFSSPQNRYLMMWFFFPMKRIHKTLWVALFGRGGGAGWGLLFGEAMELHILYYIERICESEILSWVESNPAFGRDKYIDPIFLRVVSFASAKIFRINNHNYCNNQCILQRLVFATKSANSDEIKTQDD